MKFKEFLWASGPYAVVSVRCQGCEASCPGANVALVKHVDITPEAANASPLPYISWDDKIYRLLVDTSGEDAERLLSLVQRIASNRAKRNPIAGLWAQLDAAHTMGTARPN